MLRLINVLLSFTVFAGVMACCCPCGRIPIFVPQPVQVPVPQPVPPPVNPIQPPPKKDGNQPPVQDPSEEKIRKLNANVIRDNAQPDRPVVEVKFQFPPQWKDSDLRELAAFPQLRKLELGQNQEATGAGLKDLAGLQRLEYLDASGFQISDEGARAIANLKGLRVLKVVLTKVSPPALKDLTKLSGLEDLVATNAKDDNAIKEFGKLTKLQKLQVDNSDFGDESAKGIALLPELRTLLLYGTRVTDVGLAEIAKIEQLEELKVGYSITDKGVMALAGKNNLRILSLWNNSRVTDASVPTLMTLTGLTELECKLSLKSQIQLRKAIPKIKIISR